MNINYKAVGVTIIVFLSIIVAASGYIDDVSHDYTEKAVQRSLIAFGVARGLNGVISVVQGTEIAVHPAGFGVNFTPGQVLDPVNDLVEQFSWIMLLSATSLGIQKLFLNIGSTFTATLILTISLLLLLYVVWRPDSFGPQLRKSIILLSIFLVFIRFSVPTATIMGQGIYQGFLSSDYLAATKSLEQSRDSFGELNTSTKSENGADSTVFEQAKRYLESTQNSLNFEKKISKYQELAGEISNSAIKLVVVFVAQSIILPIIFLWGIWLGLKSLMRRITASSFI